QTQEQVRNQLGGLGIALEVSGAGRAIAQDPAPGDRAGRQHPRPLRGGRRRAMIRLSTLLAALPAELAPGATPGAGPGIRGIRIDSRAVAPGDLFVALRGATADGHAFLEQATSLGAVALLVEAAPAAAGLPPVVVVPDTRRALAPIAARFFGEPAREL